MRIVKTSCGVEKEPLRKAFGFKGNALTCLWQVAVRLATEDAQGVGLGVQSVLWSDAQVFSRYGEEPGNSMMLRTTTFALAQLQDAPLRHPRDMMQQLFPKVYAYASNLTKCPELRKTFVRNALVPVDLALWQLWLQETGRMDADAIWEIPHEKQNRLANVPLITYGTGEEEILALARANTPLLKIKIGSDPGADGSVDAMVSWDCSRLLQIHHLVKDIPTTLTQTGHILYYLDANGRYDSKETLLRLLDFAGAHDILERVLLLEEPFAEDCDIFVGDLPVLVAADESVHGMEELHRRFSQGYRALALKPIAKGLTASLEMARFALEKGMHCFCADLTVNPLMVTWNLTLAARLPQLPGMLVGIVESNGSQNYSNWQTMLRNHPAYGSPWLIPEGGIYQLGEAFFRSSGGIFQPAPYYETLAERSYMETKIWNVGILGCGMIAHYHARALSELPQANLVGAFDRSGEVCETFCRRYGIRSFSSMEDLLAFPRLDAVCICLPSGLHYETALACIRAGKHVIVEKPMTFTTAQADAVIAAAQEAGTQVSAISQLRCSDAVAQLKQALEEGWFGTLATVDVYMKYWREPSYYSTSSWKGTLKMDGGGALINQGIHGVDLLRYLAGPVVSVQALTATRCHSIEGEDTVAAVLEFETGALGTLQATTSVYPGFSRRLEICGSEGTAILQEDSIVYSAFRDPSRQLTCTQSRHNTGSRPDGMDHTLHKKQIGAFLDALSGGKKPFLDAVEGKKTVQIVEAVYTSAKTGQKIYLSK